MIEQLYLTSALGQLHARVARPATPTQRPILLIPASPSSSKLYLELLATFGRTRPAIAFDTPGYGELTPPPEPFPDCIAIAQILRQGLIDLGYGQERVDVFGHHSGAMIALALASVAPELVGTVVVSGTPYISDAAARADRRARYPTVTDPAKIEATMAHNWKFWVTDGDPGVPFGRRVGLHVDSLGAGVRGSWLYRASYADGVEAWLPRISRPVVLFQIDDFLTPNNAELAGLIPATRSVARPDLTHFAFYGKPEDVCAVINAETAR